MFGVIGLLILLNIGKSALGIGAVRPDYQFAYVGGAPLPEETAAALEGALEAFGEDVNGDGRVVVLLHSYVVGGVTEERDASYVSANRVRLMADLERGDSAFFLLDDPETFQKSYQILSRLNGSLPSEYAASYEDCYLAWNACPRLTALELGGYETAVLGETVSGENQMLLAPLYLARRWYADGNAQNDAMWNAMTEEADE